MKKNKSNTPGNIILNTRMQLKIKQDDLAWMTGIAASSISAIEHGRLKSGTKRAFAIAEALNIPPLLLLNQNDENSLNKIRKRARIYWEKNDSNR